MAKLRVGQERYYFSTVAGTASAPDGLVEPDPYYLGQGARALGLEGRPSKEVVAALLSRRDPASGEPLAASALRPVEVAGFDLTFSAPKSVSLVQALSTGGTGDRVRRAHEEAVSSAFSFIEQELVSLRRSEEGRRYPVSTEGLIAVAFPHRTSRASDPHLHTHVLVANLARGADGRFSALDARRLFSSQRLVRALFDSELRARLSRQNMAFSEPRRGFSDLAGISRQTVREFSRQGVRIEAALAAAGPLRPGDRDELRARLRPPKDLSRPYPVLVAEWRERAHEMGLSRRRLEAALGAGPPGLAEPGSPGGPEEWLRAGLRDPSGTVSREELCYGRAASDQGGALLSEVLGDVDRLLESGQLESLGGRYVVPGAVERLRGLGEELAEQAGGTDLRRLFYARQDRLQVLDEVAVLAGSARLVALLPGRRAAEAFSAATGAESLPVRWAGRLQRSFDWVVLGECARFTAPELEAGLRLARSSGAGVVLFGSEESLGRSHLLSPLLSRAEPLERTGVKREPPPVDLTFGGLVVEAVERPSLACRRAARLAHVEARQERPVLVLVPERCFKEAVSAELVSAGGSPRVRVGLAGRAEGRRGETVISVGNLPAGRPREEVTRAVLVLSSGRGRGAREASSRTRLSVENGHLPAARWRQPDRGLSR